MLRAYLAPFDKNAAYAVGHDTYGRWPVNVGYTDLQGYLSKEQYVKGLRTAVRELALDGDAVFHGHGARLFIPAQVEAFHVFVMASEVSRRRRYAVEQGLSAKNAARALAQVDRRTLAVHRHLLSSDPLDLSTYDLVLNLDRLSEGKAVTTLVGAVDSTDPAARREVFSPTL